MSLGVSRFFSGGTPLKEYLEDILKAIQSYPAFSKDVQSILDKKDRKLTDKYSRKNANVRNPFLVNAINLYHPILEYMVSNRKKGDHTTLYNKFSTERSTIIGNCADAVSAYTAKKGKSAKSDTQELCDLLPTVNAKIADYFSLHEPPSSILGNALAASRLAAAGAGPLPSRRLAASPAAPVPAAPAPAAPAPAAPAPAAPVITTAAAAAASAAANLPPAAPVVVTNPFAAAAPAPAPAPAPAAPVVTTNPFAAAAAAPPAPPLPAPNNPFESPEAIAAEEAIAAAADNEAVEAEQTAFAIELGVKAMGDFNKNSKNDERRLRIAGMQPKSQSKFTMNRTAQKNRGLELIAAMQKDKKKYLAAARERLAKADQKEKARRADAAKESSVGHNERARRLFEIADHYERIKMAQQRIIDAYEQIKDKPEIEVIKNPLAAAPAAPAPPVAPAAPAAPAASASAPAAPPTVGIAKPTGCFPGGCFPWGRKTRSRKRRTARRKQTRRQR